MFSGDACKFKSEKFEGYSLRFKTKVTFGHKLRYEIKVTFGEISLKLRQTNWIVARNNINVVATELSSRITIYTCLIIDIWTRRRRRTSTRNCTLQCHPPKMAGFQWNWRQKFLTLLWTRLARRKCLVRTMQCMQFCAKGAKNDLKPRDFLKCHFYFETEGVYSLGTWVLLYSPGQANPGANSQSPSLHGSGMFRIHIGNYWTIVVVVVVVLLILESIVNGSIITPLVIVVV